MHATRVFCRLTAAIAFLAGGIVPSPAQRMDSSRLGVAPEAYRGMAFQGGGADLNPDTGGGYAEFRYTDAGSGGRQRVLLIQAQWIEKARGNQQRVQYPRIQIGGSFDGVFSPSHQVSVSVRSTYPELLAPAEGLPLARQIAAGLQDRALPWADEILAFRPPERIEELHLERSALYAPPQTDRDTGHRTAEFRYTTPIHDLRGQVLPRGWRADIRIEWQKQAPRMDQSPGQWILTDTERRAQERRDPALKILIFSPTHLARAIVGGERWDGAQQKWVPLFDDAQARERTLDLARRFLSVAESKLALPRPGDGGRWVTDRPPPAGPPPAASGSILSVEGPVMFIRNRNRVHIEAGGRVAKGDVIIVGSGGQVRIQFDDPHAGPDGSGRLIASKGKYTIDANPVAAKPNVHITVEGGAARFVRPGVATELEVGLAVPGTVFGQMAGTDVTLIHYAESKQGLTLLAVDKGHVQATLPREGILLMEGADKVMTFKPSDRLNVQAGWVLKVSSEDPVLLTRLKPGGYDRNIRDFQLGDPPARQSATP